MSYTARRSGLTLKQEKVGEYKKYTHPSAV